MTDQPETISVHLHVEIDHEAKVLQVPSGAGSASVVLALNAKNIEGGTQGLEITLLTGGFFETKDDVFGFLGMVQHALFLEDQENSTVTETHDPEHAAE